MSNKKLKDAAKIIAAEEMADNPSQYSNKELEKEIYQELLRNQNRKNEQADIAIEMLDKVQGIINKGGLKAIGMKFLMYFLLPLLVLVGLGYMLYEGVKRRKVVLNFIKGINNSRVYSDKKTKWRLRVKELLPDVEADRDRENFEKIKEKMKGVYL